MNISVVFLEKSILIHEEFETAIIHLHLTPFHIWEVQDKIYFLLAVVCI